MTNIATTRVPVTAVHQAPGGCLMPALRDRRQHGVHALKVLNHMRGTCVRYRY